MIKAALMVATILSSTTPVAAFWGVNTDPDTTDRGVLIGHSASGEMLRAVCAESGELVVSLIYPSSESLLELTIDAMLRFHVDGQLVHDEIAVRYAYRDGQIGAGTLADEGEKAALLAHLGKATESILVTLLVPDLAGALDGATDKSFEQTASFSPSNARSAVDDFLQSCMN